VDRNPVDDSTFGGLFSKRWRLLVVFFVICLIFSSLSLFFLWKSWSDFIVQAVFLFLFLAALADRAKPYFVAAHITVSAFLESLFYLTLLISIPHQRLWFLVGMIVIMLVGVFSYRLLRTFLSPSYQG
jgi:hypothetical protein